MAGNEQKLKAYTTMYTKDYKGPSYNGGLYNFLLSPERPIFFRMFVPIMMRDPHLWYGIELLKGPIVSKAKYVVESEDSELAEFIQKQIDRFWRKGISYALDSLIWGYSGCEVLYQYSEKYQCLEFKELIYLHPMDIKPVVCDGKLIAMEIRNAEKENGKIYLKPPKILWCVHDKKRDRFFGRSRLEGAFDSWYELWQPKGYRSIRHLWYYRHAYDGGVLYYPDGSTQDPETQQEIPNAQIANEILDRKETGSSIALPNRGGEGNREWEYDNPKGNAIPEGLLEYGDILRDELWEGIGVPPEVAKQEGTGSFAGRRVPQQAFYSMLQEIADDLMWDLREQVLDKLAILFAQHKDYEIRPVSILETLQQEEMGLVTGKLGQEGQDQEDEQQFDEDGNPIEEEGQEEEDGSNQKNPFTKGGQLKSGKLEDRNSNGFNLSEKAVKNSKKKKKGK